MAAVHVGEAMVVEAAGIDTWSVCWRLTQDCEAYRAMEGLATQKASRSMLIEEPVSGHRVGWFPSARLMFAEGHPVEGGLASMDELPGALEGLTKSLGDLGVDLTPGRDRHRASEFHDRDFGIPKVRRLDSTLDLRFESAAEGLAVLAGVASLPLPRMKTGIVREAGGRRIETVQFRGLTGKTMLGRWYDKGVESGSDGRGFRIRPEDQRRFVKGARPLVSDMAASTFARDSFVRRFEPLWKASKGIKVGSCLELAKRLAELQRSGHIGHGEAKSVAGHLLLETAQAHLQSPRQVRRDRALARRHGLVLADGVLDEVEIDLQEVLEAAMDAEAWGSSG